MKSQKEGGELKGERKLHTVLFKSRNKDNRDLKEFVERQANFITEKTVEEVNEKFVEFAKAGLKGEISRFYFSVNERDGQKVRKALMHFLIDNDDYSFYNIESKVASLASKPECALTKKWLFDVDDCNDEEIGKFLIDLCEYSNYGLHEIMLQKTVTGFSASTPSGFDTRELLIKYENATLVRDGMWLINYIKNT